MSSRKDDLRPEYAADLIKSGVRGKYAERYREDGLVFIDRDLRELFPDWAAVNRALRAYVAQRKRSAT